jgi:hypothetical protein
MPPSSPRRPAICHLYLYHIHGLDYAGYVLEYYESEHHYHSQQRHGLVKTIYAPWIIIIIIIIIQLNPVTYLYGETKHSVLGYAT